MTKRQIEAVLQELSSIDTENQSNEIEFNALQEAFPHLSASYIKRIISKHTQQLEWVPFINYADNYMDDKWHAALVLLFIAWLASAISSIAIIALYLNDRISFSPAGLIPIITIVFTLWATIIPFRRVPKN